MIIFIDEVDSLLSNSKRGGGEFSDSGATINKFLEELDGFSDNDNIMVIGATNNLENIDKAAIRAGRFDLKINVPVPDLEGRKEIFELNLKKIKFKKDCKRFSIVIIYFSRN